MRTIIAAVLMCLLSGNLPVFAAEPVGGVVMAAALREATRLGFVGVAAGQQKTGSARHPVLIGPIPPAPYPVGTPAQRARAAFIDAAPREERLVALQDQHVPACASLGVVAPLAGLHPTVRRAQPPDFLAGPAAAGGMPTR